jgi:hypothetical protein
VLSGWFPPVLAGMIVSFFDPRVRVPVQNQAAPPSMAAFPNIKK